MQIREQPGGVLPGGDRRPLHNRAGDRFDSAPNVSVCTRYLELTFDSVSFFLCRRWWFSGSGAAEVSSSEML
jgi:hypothetical protein